MSKLITLLENQITESDTTESEVGQQRERNHRYYSMQPLGNERRGFSHYIDPRVFSAVEDKKAVFSETFLSSRQVVRFNGASKDESDAKTAYVQRVLKDNKYADLFRDGWHDAFVAKRMTVWVDWRRNHEQVSLRFTGAPSRAIHQQLQQLGKIVDIDQSQLQSFPIPSIGQQQFVHTGELTVTIDKSYIDLDLVQPEFVLRDPEQTHAYDALWNAARIDITRLMLEDWGFDPDQVKKLNPDYRWGTSEEEYARKAHDRSSTGTRAGRRLGDQEEVTIYKTRTWLTPEEFENAGIDDFEPEQGAAIYEIYWGHGEVLHWNDGTPAIKVLDEMAVYEWTEFKISHAEHGLCTADVESHQQKAGSGIKRGVMDNMNIVNNPRYEANTQALKNPRDLYDNHIGGVIETDGKPPGNVLPLPQPDLSPMVMGVMQMLDRDSERRNGMSDLARGMNMGAVNNQNADSMIERLTTAGARRVAMIARDFANTFMVPLMQCIVRYGMKYDASSRVLESGGRQIPIAPSQWSDDVEMEIEVALTPEEAEMMAQRLMMVDARLGQDEDMKILYGVKQKHALWDTIYELMGIKDSTKFLGAPESPKVQQALKSRAQQAQQMQQKQDQLQRFQMSAMREQLDQRWSELNSKAQDRLEDNNLAEREFLMERHFKQEELNLEKTQKRAVSVD